MGSQRKACVIISSEPNVEMETCCFGGAYKVILFYAIYLTQIIQSKQIKCIENGKFYRDPARPGHTVWTPHECSKYFLCLEGEVFEFHCSTGLLFDVNRQICDFKANVDNCDITSGIDILIPKPLLEKASCPNKKFGCADGTCLPQDYFCDGSLDCPDGSDEGHCDPKRDPFAASVCNPSKCKLPDCFCSTNGTAIPGNLAAKDVPQMIVLTFDDAVNADNWDFYDKLLTSNRKNPNGCPIRATFFVSHQYNNYQQTQKLWNYGHEIAVHSVTYVLDLIQRHLSNAYLTKKMTTSFHTKWFKFNISFLSKDGQSSFFVNIGKSGQL